MSPRTRHNLMTAMQCDALDSAKYGEFAARARKDDDWELAKAFQEAADRDRTEHFAKEAQLEGLIAASPNNLRAAIDSEREETTLFARFAREANEDGDPGTAGVFERISRDKAELCARLEAVLGEMGIHGSVRTLTA